MHFPSWAWGKVEDEKWWPRLLAWDPFNCSFCSPFLPWNSLGVHCSNSCYNPNSKNLVSQIMGSYLLALNCVDILLTCFFCLALKRLPLMDDVRNGWVKSSRVFIVACWWGYCPLNQWTLFEEPREKFKAWVRERHCFIWKTTMLYFLWTDSIL